MSAKNKEAWEVVQNTPKSKEEYENSILGCIRDFYYSNFNAETTEQICKCGQNSFVAACTYAGRECISRDDLKCLVPHNVNNYSVVQNETYDQDKVDQIAQIYLDICFLFDKVPSIYGFSELTGIDRGTLQGWIKEGKEVRLQRRGNTPKKAVQKVRDARAESLQNVAISGGKGTVGAIACLNNNEWKDREPEREERPVVSVYDLPDLSDLRHLPVEKELPTIEMPQFNENGEFIGIKLV